MKKRMIQSELKKRFEKEILHRQEMNFLKGGDGHGSQPGDDPWDPNG